MNKVSIWYQIPAVFSLLFLQGCSQLKSSNVGINDFTINTAQTPAAAEPTEQSPSTAPGIDCAAGTKHPLTTCNVVQPLVSLTPVPSINPPSTTNPPPVVTESPINPPIAVQNIARATKPIYYLGDDNVATIMTGRAQSQDIYVCINEGSVPNSFGCRQDSNFVPVQKPNPINPDAELVYQTASFYTYSNLKFGDYTFNLRTKSREGKWLDSESVTVSLQFNKAKGVPGCRYYADQFNPRSWCFENQEGPISFHVWCDGGSKMDRPAADAIAYPFDSDCVYKAIEDVPQSIRTTAGLVIGAKAIIGDIEKRTDQDWYRVYLEAGVSYTFNMDFYFSQLDPLLVLYNLDGLEVARSGDQTRLLFQPWNSELIYTPSATGIFFVSAQGFSVTNGIYKLSAIKSSEQRAPTTIESGDILASVLTSANLNIGEVFTSTIEKFGASGQAGLTEDKDWWRVSLTAGTKYVLKLNRYNSQLHSILILRDHSGKELDRERNSFDGDSILFFTPDRTGEYFLESRAFSTTWGNYTISVELDSL